MTLDTFPVTLTGSNLAPYLRQLNLRGESFHFLSTEVNGTVALDLQRDGSETDVWVVLRPDGTWYMAAHLVIGEKL